MKHAAIYDKWPKRASLAGKIAYQNCTWLQCNLETVMMLQMLQTIGMVMMLQTMMASVQELRVTCQWQHLKVLSGTQKASVALKVALWSSSNSIAFSFARSQFTYFFWHELLQPAGLRLAGKSPGSSWQFLATGRASTRKALAQNLENQVFAVADLLLPSTLHLQLLSKVLAHCAPRKVLRKERACPHKPPSQVDAWWWQKSRLKTWWIYNDVMRMTDTKENIRETNYIKFVLRPTNYTLYILLHHDMHFSLQAGQSRPSIVSSCIDQEGSFRCRKLESVKVCFTKPVAPATWVLASCFRHIRFELVQKKSSVNKGLPVKQITQRKWC